MIEDKLGNKRWYNSDSQLHRIDGPAVVLSSGTKKWYLNGKRHRENGPAFEYGYIKFWYFNDKCHRQDGPAVVLADGTKEWWLNGKLHRQDGPAVERPNGAKLWYLHGKQLTEEEFFAETYISPFTGKRV